MDIQDLKTLLLDLNCMTAFRHVMDNPAIRALVDLCVACVQDRMDEESLTEAYCRVYQAWLQILSEGRGGFAREALQAVLFEDSATARICSKGGVLPYSLLNGMGHDLETIGQLTSIEPAMFLLLCERAGMPGHTAVRLPVWEPTVGINLPDERMDEKMLSREGVSKVVSFFETHGTGLFAKYPAATYVGVDESHPMGLRGVSEPDPVCLDDLIQYEEQRGALIDNTKRLLAGKRAGNVLLYGDKGTGKSATVKALLGSFFKEGLRIVEVTPQHLTHLQEIFAALREFPCKFIVFVDDLAFNDSCPEYTALKTVLEGGLEARPSNVVVYATSNRRNIVRQRFSERQDDVNERDTLEEKFSLADRFDFRLTFLAPSQEEYEEICQEMLARRGIEIPWESLKEQARGWTVQRAGRSPRIARQFVDMIAGEAETDCGEKAETEE